MPKRLSKLGHILIGFLIGTILTSGSLLLIWSRGSQEVPELLLGFEGHDIDLNSIMDGDWSEVCFVPPYTPKGAAKKIVGAPVYEVVSSRTFANDGHTLAAFKKPSGEIAFYDIPRSNVDFTKVAGACYRRSNASFVIPLEDWPYATHP